VELKPAQANQTHFFPFHLIAGGLPAEPDVVKVDRPEGGDPMYSWGGTLTTSGAAYNRL
jgi:hypothetical protein